MYFAEEMRSKGSFSILMVVERYLQCSGVLSQVRISQTLFQSSMNNLQSVSIVAAFPIGAVIVMIAISFMKDAKKYMESLDAEMANKRLK